jgi:hypothetical protein
MDKLNYHKLINLRKRFDKYVDCDIADDIVSVIDKHIEIEKKKSIQNDLERRSDYQNQLVVCGWCHKSLYRGSLYNHKKCCRKKPLENNPL